MKKIISASVILMLALLVIMISDQCRSDQPPYQVSLFIHLHPKGAPIHLCNGAIVQNKLILTTAACVHYLLIPGKPIIPVHPSMLTVVAGSENAFADALRIKVDEIVFHEKFNETTMENDLALLRLETPLPLGIRDDIKWIILDEFKPRYAPCLANFYVRNSMDTIPDYTQTVELRILNKTICKNLAKFPEARKKDICSNYILPSNFQCKDIDSFIPFNGDRGTAMICNSRIVALLSSILIVNRENQEDCSEDLVYAYYTNISPYIEWAWEIIMEEESEALERKNYIASAPFDQETESIIQSFMTIAVETETIITDSKTSPLPTMTTKRPTLDPDSYFLSKNAASRILGGSIYFFFYFCSFLVFGESFRLQSSL